MDPQARKTKCRLNTLLTPNPSCERQGRGRRPTPPSSRRQPADSCNIKVARNANQSRAISLHLNRPGAAKRRGPGLAWLVVDLIPPHAILTPLGAWGRRAGTRGCKEQCSAKEKFARVNGTGCADVS